MKDCIALLIIGGIILSVSIVLLLLQYIMPSVILFGIATIILACSIHNFVTFSIFSAVLETNNYNSLLKLYILTHIF